MRISVSRLTAALAFIACFSVPRSAEGRESWCEACGDWRPEPHGLTAHLDPNTGQSVEIAFCRACDAWVPAPHGRHLFETETGKEVGGNGGGTSGNGGKGERNDWVSRLLDGFRPWMLAVPAVLFVLLAVLSALVRIRRAAAGVRPRPLRPFPMVRGVPQGVVLVPGRLVCEKEGVGDGGTATGHRAMCRADAAGAWTPAFVKRMVGRSLGPDQRFPALQFEAAILHHLSPTGAVPRVFVPPTVTDAAGETWSYFAMSVAPGGQWPERGGLGRDTRRALSALCETLVKLHERGIGHYDLKPQNIFWEPKGRRITLIDFGSAIDHNGTYVNPLSAMYPMTVPWIAPASDGRHLADLTPASDAWVYGLLFCEAVVGGVHEPDRTKRRWPEKSADREWFREALAAAESPVLAEAVVEGLFDRQASGRMSLSDFLAVLRKEWGI